MKHTYFASALLLLVTACGGGGDDAPAPSTPPVQTASLSITGTAATGAAIAGGTVDVKCATGTGTATTGTSGGYTVSIAGGAAPCALRVTSGGTVLHSLVPSGSGASATANITPLTELLVAQLAGGAPASLFGSFDASAQARVTPAALTSAIAAAKAVLQGTVDLTGVDPIHDALVPAAGGTAGNALDQMLDNLALALAAAQTTLADLSTAVAASGDNAGPAQTLLKPAAAQCAALHSGKYRVINPHETKHDPDFATMLVTLDATALTLSDEVEHVAVPLTADADTACRYTYEGDFGTETALVSPSGVIVVLSPSSTGPLRTSLMIPEQTVPLAQLAGNWNYMAYVREPDALLKPVNGSAVIDAAGKFVSGTECTGLKCADWGTPVDQGDLVVNAKGGFTTTYQGATGLVFPFVSADGSVSMFVLDPNEGGLSVFSKQKAQPLPTVGAVTKFWDFTIGTGSFSWAPSNGAQGVIASALTDSKVTVTAADAAARTYSRVRESDGRVDGFTLDNPRVGLRYRPAGTVPTSAGTTTVSATINMTVAGTGLVVYSSGEGQNFFGFSVNHP